MINKEKLQEAKSKLVGLKQWSDRIGSDEHSEISDIINLLKQQEEYLKELSKRCIIWSVEDFISQAEQRWDSDFNMKKYPSAIKWQDIYDESKFQNALHEMIQKQDCEYGITWESINFYLDKYCLKDYDSSIK